MALLEVDGISVVFGGHTAVENVTIDVEPGSITGLIGPNGAGKTTLFNVISGLQPATKGQVRFAGERLTNLAPYSRARKGIARTFQRLELFTSLSVRDNIVVAGEIRNRWSTLRLGRLNVDAEADRLISMLGLDAIADRDVSEIPTGQARVVELGRALMMQPRLVLLDEPASGQNEDETEAFGGLLRRLVDEGTTIFLVEHDMSLVMAACDEINVLDFGRLIATGTPAEIQSDAQVLDAYLGAEA